MPHLLTTELSSLAYTKVKSMIIAKKLVPGKKIVQDKLAEDLGISRTPLRTALQKLEAENLVESIPRRGVIVKKFSDAEIIEIYECRIALETAAVRLFTNVATAFDILKLENLFKPFIKGQLNIQKYQNADSEFHSTILEKSGNRLLNELFKKGNLILCIDMIGLVRPPEDTINEHLEIIEAIRQRDVDLAESLTKSHLEKSRILFQQKLDEQD